MHAEIAYSHTTAYLREVRAYTKLVEQIKVYKEGLKTLLETKASSYRRKITAYTHSYSLFLIFWQGIRATLGTSLMSTFLEEDQKKRRRNRGKRVDPADKLDSPTGSEIETLIPVPPTPSPRGVGHGEQA